MRNINEIILHCSATKEGLDVTIEDIDHWCRERGFRACGYHYVIYRDGTVRSGRALSQVGAHTINHNTNSIGICYIGGLDSQGHAADTRTPAQKQSLRKLLTDLHQRFPRAIILGHRDLSPDLNHDGRITPNEFIKQCPCLDAMVEYQDLQPEGFWEGKPIYK